MKNLKKRSDVSLGGVAHATLNKLFSQIMRGGRPWSGIKSTRRSALAQRGANFP